MSEKEVPKVFIEPSAAGPSQTVTREGVVLPGKNHEARVGQVTNPGVRKVSTATVGPRCPQCGEATLKMRMNRKVGERIFCSNSGCSYDQAKSTVSKEGGIHPNPETQILDSRSNKSSERGVRIISQRHGG